MFFCELVLVILPAFADINIPSVYVTESLDLCILAKKHLLVSSLHHCVLVVCKVLVYNTFLEYFTKSVEHFLFADLLKVEGFFSLSFKPREE